MGVYIKARHGGLGSRFFGRGRQADHVAALDTCVIVPLRRPEAVSTPSSGLNPLFDVGGTTVYADMAKLASFPQALMRKAVANVHDERLAIEDALDFLFTGF
jgi:toxin CcdB